jgi:hypothetical protein
VDLDTRRAGRRLKLLDDASQSECFEVVGLERPAAVTRGPDSS